MISRRNIRVKVMQSLYAIDSFEGSTKANEIDSILQIKINQTRDLFSYLIYFTSEVARYAELDAHLKASKHLPTAQDLTINTKISGNELLWKIIDNKSFQEVVEKNKFSNDVNRDLLKKIYNELILTQEYNEYIETQTREKKYEKKIIEFIFSNLMLPNEEFIIHVEELFINWDDDAILMQTLVLNYFNKPTEISFVNIISQEKADFAKELLRTVIDKETYSLELIKPKLNNWDADRIAALDLIILQMGVCEFLYFDTIPTKVTINEYIDLAKEYSTPQSGQFVNGLLDNIHKDLMNENKILKKQFKNSKI